MASKSCDQTSPVVDSQSHSNSPNQDVSNQSSSVPIQASSSPESQSFDFNFAVDFLAKVKNRFRRQPDVFKQFMGILVRFKREQENLENGFLIGSKFLTREAVYAQMTKLFQNEVDLLLEFHQFVSGSSDSANKHVGLSNRGFNGVHSFNDAPRAIRPANYKDAFNYFKRVKKHFHGRPDILKQFFRIIYTYRREQPDYIDGTYTGIEPLTVAEVHAQTPNLFQNEEDLVQEFQQFSPDEMDVALNGLVVKYPEAKYIGLKEKTDALF